MDNPFETLLNEIKGLGEKIDALQIQNKEDLSIKKYSIKESAEILGVIPLTVRNHIKSGTIKASQIGRKYYINHSELFNDTNEVKSLKYKR